MYNGAACSTSNSPFISPGWCRAQVTALLTQLAEMRAADAGAKAVVFSAWGRLLKLVGGALAANGVQHVSLAGAQPAARAEALHRFIHDPDCTVILIVLSTGGARTPLSTRNPFSGWRSC